MNTLKRPQDAVCHDTYRVAWSPRNEESVATVAEFPRCRGWLAASPFAALEGLQALPAEVVADLQQQDADVPEPLSERTYSGKFNLRLGEKLYRDVALRAAEENLGINQWVVRGLLAEI